MTSVASEVSAAEQAQCLPQMPLLDVAEQLRAQTSIGRGTGEPTATVS